MKNYFNFTLTGEKFLPVWLLFYLLFILPYFIITISMTRSGIGEEVSPLLVFAIFVVIIIALFISFYIMKMSIENIEYSEKGITFQGTFGGYTGKIFTGLLLTIITLGIYMPWFVRNLTRFYINNSSLDSDKFNFRGEGGRLFVIFLVAFILPMVFLTLMFYFVIKGDRQDFLQGALLQGVTCLVLIPFLYYYYKWYVDINFRDYHITWETDFGESFSKILGQILLSFITFGIYMPMAYLRLYEYFSERTIARKEGSVLKFGYEMDAMNDFLYIWGQLLLTIVTAGIYFPWAYSKVGKRVLGKTYVVPFIEE